MRIRSLVVGPVLRDSMWWTPVHREGALGPVTRGPGFRSVAPMTSTDRTGRAGERTGTAGPAASDGPTASGGSAEPAGRTTPSTSAGPAASGEPAESAAWAGPASDALISPAEPADSAEPAEPAAVNPHLRRVVLIVGEIVRAALWIPLLIALIPLALAFHLVVPAAAATERTIARAVGAKAPSARLGAAQAQHPGRPRGSAGRTRGSTPPEGLGRWLASRVTRSAFWRQDLPLCLGALMLTTVGFFLTTIGGLLAITCIAIPFMATPDRPIRIDACAVHMVGARAGEIWWTAPIGVAVLVLTLALLLGLGALRTRMVEALSENRQAKRIEALTAEVGHLTAGRATLVDAFDAERARIERDLHDGAQQELVALAMALGTTRLRTESLDALGRTGELRADLLADLDVAQDRAEAALRSLRETVHGIRPAVLTERGLSAALRDLAGRAPLPTTVRISDDAIDRGSVSSPVSTTVYFAIAEALTNAARHAGAGARAVVELECAAEGLTAVVADDGCGGAEAETAGSTGLRGMAQRVESVGGALNVVSPVGGGTTLTITAPLIPPWATGEDAARGGF